MYRLTMFSYYKKEFINSVYVLAMKRLNDLDYLKLNNYICELEDKIKNNKILIFS